MRRQSDSQEYAHSSLSTLPTEFLLVFFLILYILLVRSSSPPSPFLTHPTRSSSSLSCVHAFALFSHSPMTILSPTTRWDCYRCLIGNIISFLFTFFSPLRFSRLLGLAFWEPEKKNYNTESRNGAEKKKCVESQQQRRQRHSSDCISHPASTRSVWINERKTTDDKRILGKIKKFNLKCSELSCCCCRAVHFALIIHISQDKHESEWTVSSCALLAALLLLFGVKIWAVAESSRAHSKEWKKFVEHLTGHGSSPTEVRPAARAYF